MKSGVGEGWKAECIEKRWGEGGGGLRRQHTHRLGRPVHAEHPPCAPSRNRCKGRALVPRAPANPHDHRMRALSCAASRAVARIMSQTALRRFRGRPAAATSGRRPRQQHEGHAQRALAHAQVLVKGKPKRRRRPQVPLHLPPAAICCRRARAHPTCDTAVTPGGGPKPEATIAREAAPPSALRR